MSTATPAPGPGAARRAVVTGTAHGIGRAIAQALEAQGMTVVGVDRDRCDLSDPGSARSFFAEMGEVDVLVNCAGGVAGQVHRPIDEVPDSDWQAVLQANLQTTFNCTREVARGMKHRRWGRIVNISSGAGRSVSLTGIQAYTTAKAAQIGFTRQMAHELGPHGVTVNCIAPGFILSNPTSIAQWQGYGPEGQARLQEGIAMRRLGTPEDIAQAVRFFVSEGASWVTGQVLAVDGGHALF